METAPIDRETFIEVTARIPAYILRYALAIGKDWDGKPLDAGGVADEFGRHLIDAYEENASMWADDEDERNGFPV